MIKIKMSNNTQPELVIVIGMEGNPENETAGQKRHELDVLAEEVFKDILDSLWDMEELGCNDFEDDMRFVSEFIERLTSLAGAEEAYPVLFSLVRIAYEGKNLEEIERAVARYDDGKEMFLTYFAEAAARHYLEGDEEDDD